MSLKLVEILVLGQVLRLNVPIEQEELLRQAARNLDILVSEMKEKTGLIQLGSCALYCGTQFEF